MPVCLVRGIKLSYAMSITASFSEIAETMPIGGVPILNNAYIPSSTEDQERSLHKIVTSTWCIYSAFYEYLFNSSFELL